MRYVVLLFSTGADIPLRSRDGVKAGNLVVEILCKPRPPLEIDRHAVVHTSRGSPFCDSGSQCFITDWDVVDLLWRGHHCIWT